MVTTAGLLNPARASLGLTSPVIARTPKTRSAKTSKGIHSVISSTITAAKITSTMIISADISFSASDDPGFSLA